MPGPLVHDRLARLGEPVDERGLADVRVADDGDLHRSRQPRASDCDLRDDLVEREAGGVDGRRRRRPARAPCGRRVGVALVALVQLAEHRVRVGARARRRGGARAPRGAAVRKTLTSASGATTEPMSRPSATQSPSLEDRLLLAHQRRAHARVGGHPRGAARTPRACGSPSVTSRPSSSTPVADLELDRLGHGGGVLFALGAASATARYIAPVSRYVKPSRSRDGARDGGLSGPGGAVDGDHHGSEASLAPCWGSPESPPPS